MQISSLVEDHQKTCKTKSDYMTENRKVIREDLFSVDQQVTAINHTNTIRQLGKRERVVLELG